MDFSNLYQDSEKSQALLQDIRSFFIKELSLIPVMAIELEFFFLPNKDSDIILDINKLEELTNSVSVIANNHGIKIGSLAKEVGNLQYEVNFLHSTDLRKVAQDVEKIKDILSGVATSYDLSVCFLPKPYTDMDVGSGMHIHLSLLDGEGKNVFAKKGDEESQELLYAIAGLLKFLPDSLPFFVTQETDFDRFRAKFDLPKDEMRYKCNATNAPTNISWGVNNRTTSIRIPDSYKDRESRRIEHRVPSSSANPYLALIGVLLGAYYGISEELEPQQKTWGNAFDEQYHLESLPLNLEEANNNFNCSKLKSFFDELLIKA